MKGQLTHLGGTIGRHDCYRMSEVMVEPIGCRCHKRRRGDFAAPL